MVVKGKRTELRRINAEKKQKEKEKRGGEVGRVPRISSFLKTGKKLRYERKRGWIGIGREKRYRIDW